MEQLTESPSEMQILQWQLQFVQQMILNIWWVEIIQMEPKLIHTILCIKKKPTAKQKQNQKQQACT